MDESIPDLQMESTDQASGVPLGIPAHWTDTGNLDRSGGFKLRDLWPEREYRRDAARDLRHRAQRKDMARALWPQGEASDDQVLEAFYSSPIERFLLFWHSVDLAHRNEHGTRTTYLRTPSPEFHILESFVPGFWHFESDTETLVRDCPVVAEITVTLASLPKSWRHTTPACLMVWCRILAEMREPRARDERELRRLADLVFACATAARHRWFLDHAIELEPGLKEALMPVSLQQALLDASESPNEASLSIEMAWRSVFGSLAAAASRALEIGVSAETLAEVERIAAEVSVLGARVQAQVGQVAAREQALAPLEQCLATLREKGELDWFDESLAAHTMDGWRAWADGRPNSEATAAAASASARVREAADIYLGAKGSLEEANRRVEASDAGLRATLGVVERAAAQTERRKLLRQRSDCEERLRDAEDALHAAAAPPAAAGEAPTPTQDYDGISSVSNQQLSKDIPGNPASESPTIVTQAAAASPSAPSCESHGVTKNRDGPPSIAITTMTPQAPGAVISETDRHHTRYSGTDTHAVRPTLVVPATPASPDVEPSPRQPERIVCPPIPLSTRELENQVSRLLDDPVDTARAEALYPLVVALQADWLGTGQHLRGYAVARYYEDVLIPRLGSPPANATPLPSWLCWLASIVFDPSGTLTERERALGDAAQNASLLAQADARVHRFALFSVCSGLAGERSSAFVELAKILVPPLAEAFEAGEAFEHFCARRILLPASQGAAPRIVPARGIEDIERAIERCLAEAESEMDPGRSNYRNNMCKRVWRDITSKNGPVSATMAAVRKGDFRLAFVSTDEFCRDVSEWGEVVSSYRHNMENRIDAFLTRLREIPALDEELREATRGAQTVLTTAVMQNAVRYGHECIERLERARCPARYGANQMLARLQSSLARRDRT